MKFALSYSFGKDSTLALHRMLQAGHEPVCMVATVNPAVERSWFHGVSPALMSASSARLGVPLLLCKTAGDDYHLQLEKTLLRAKEMGAEACVFGDIDIEQHAEWNRARCDNTGLGCMMPLWQESRHSVVEELIGSGFKAMVKCVQKPYAEALGQVLDAAVVRRLEALGADACGENGEYHTYVFNGPIFTEPVPVTTGEVLDLDTHLAIDILLAAT